MEADLVLAGKSARTRATYLQCARTFVAHLQRPPEEMGREEARGFLLHLARVKQVKPATYTVYWSALKFLYAVTLRRPDVMEGVPRPRVLRPPPDVFTRAEVSAVLDAAPCLYLRMLWETAYACGLRGEEVCNLRVEDLDGRSGLLHVRHGKGDKARVVKLPNRLLEALRHYWREERPPRPWLFPARCAGRARWYERPVQRATISHWFTRTVHKTLTTRRHLTMHGLRSAYATHLLEAGVDVAIIQVLLGHADVQTTQRYLRVRTDLILRTPSPIELPEPPPPPRRPQ
jgi:integrase